MVFHFTHILTYSHIHSIMLPAEPLAQPALLHHRLRQRDNTDTVQQLHRAHRRVHFPLNPTPDFDGYERVQTERDDRFLPAHFFNGDDEHAGEFLHEDVGGDVDGVGS